MTVQEAFQLACEHQRAGRLPQAEAICRQILAKVPNEMNALHGLAHIALQTGRRDDAERLIRHAITVEPRLAELHFSLADILHAQGRNEEVIEALQATIRLQPNHAAAHLNLGIVLDELRRPQESIDACRRSIELDPKNPDAHSQLACAFLAINRPDEAAKASLAALHLNPNHAGASNNLGEALRGLQRPDEAAMYYERALRLTTAPPQIMRNNLGIARMMQGRVEQAIAAHRRAVELQPDYAAAASNLLYTLHYSLFSDAASLTEEHARWARSIESRLGPPRKHANSPDPDRPLRIGYVSSDFRKHAVEHFIEPILAHHNHAHFEITGYSSSPLSDDSTQRLRGYCDRWREIYSLSNDAAADLIAQDGIDILIDLSVHSAGNRLAIFARKPAPVQMTYLGYPGTTGLAAIDYRVTAAGMDRPDAIEGTERLLVLPESYFCYQPPRQAPAVAEPPSLANGYVTFGSCNRLSKINDEVIAVWAKLLQTVAGSRLQLLAIGLREPATCRLFTDRFAAHGISAERIILQPSCGEGDYLAAHHRVDIALDPFPFNGGTTTLHALWMGVPIITLAGQLPVGRMGLNILTNLGLEELVAGSMEDYVAIAAQLAGDLNRLQQLRQGLRERLRQSPLMKAAEFTRDLESLYRRAWKTWCDGDTPAPP